MCELLTILERKQTVHGDYGEWCGGYADDVGGRETWLLDAGAVGMPHTDSVGASAAAQEEEGVLVWEEKRATQEWVLSAT